MDSAVRAVVKKLEESVLSTLEPVADKRFKDETVDIDGKRFTSCVFEGCVLRYSGGDVEFGPGCEIEKSRPEFLGPARRTVLFLHVLGLLSFDPFERDVQKRP